MRHSRRKGGKVEETVVVQNVQGRHNRGQENYARGAVAAGNEGVQNRVAMQILEPIQDSALNEDNLFQAYQCDAFDYNVDEAPTAQTMIMANLSSTNPISDKAGPSYDLDIISELVKDNAVPVVQSNVSSILNDALMMIINDMYEQTAQCVSVNEQSNIVNALLTVELARYKEQVELYERRAMFELNEREQKIDEQLRIIIC
nr:integrase, catalytic region, zinc finger, CCHC-type, peptidase aspartic, catalytic [Tanacetum cinerariifolium]